MNITKAKLVKGSFLEVTYSDGTADIFKSYPHTEAPTKLIKAFGRLSHHLCDLAEQYDSTGQGDYDMVSARGYSIKGEGDKEGVTITGVRALKGGGTLTLNSPFTSLDIQESSYRNIKSLVDDLSNCRAEIEAFMDNNKSPDDIQGRLFGAPQENFIVQSEQTAQARTAVDIAFEKENAKLQQNTEEGLDEEDDRTEQERMDEEMPLTQEMIQQNNARKNNRRGKSK
jgi:hypothetical protein